jgi:hypothetical protein
MLSYTSLTLAMTSARATIVKNTTFHGELLQIFFQCMLYILRFDEREKIYFFSFQ